MYKLYRDATRLIDGKYVKDISCINRDEAKVIVVDTDPDRLKLQPDNGIVLKPWKGDLNDDELPKLMKLLEGWYPLCFEHAFRLLTHGFYFNVFRIGIVWYHHEHQ
jgi:hypothetical protein